ncbi:uncharacterized protein LY89DRAFT_784572 [Mollisia scopiformis]|uniref:Carrier domain-containing protein n=1 Tax=Mollisia scopiformis TaxID=149040 RepID=A0A194X0G9_MOLSC|nr:uncharacterized protein LY89DRAFT_784572 [Mollisia scopiformis]KUJ13696.1 hypothetical protein LY89DRAFT_784572 [Mollisia scopiformis]
MGENSDNGERTVQLAPFALLLSTLDRTANVLKLVQDIADACRTHEDSIEDALPCSPMQESLMAASTERGNSYMLQMVSKLDNQVPLQEFKRAWEATSKGYPILRTSIVQLEPHGYVQAVVKDSIEWQHSGSVKDYLRSDLERLMTFGEPLWRFGIVTTDDYSAGKQRFFVWTAHHAVCDGYSIGQLLKGAALNFKRKPLPEIPPFSRFIQHLNSKSGPESQEYWRKELANSTSIPFPSLPSRVFQANPCSVFGRDIAIQWPKQLSISKALILQSAWALLLSKYTGSDDVTFGTISSGRNTPIPNIREIAGPVLALLPVTIHVEQSLSIERYLSDVYARAERMVPYQHTGLSSIRRFLGEKAASVCNFNNLVVIQPGSFIGKTTELLKYLGLSVVSELWKYETHSYPLVATMTYTDAGFHLKFEYDDRILHHQQLVHLANQYAEILGQLCAAAPTSSVRSITRLCPNDKSQIFAWNQTVPEVQDSCVHHLFERHFKESPNHLALCSSEKTLTYSEVDAIASAFAIELMKKGVGAGTLVGLCFEKSPESLLSILAIFKAGGTFVPLDPFHPRSRIEEIMDITQMQFVITSSTYCELFKDMDVKLIGFGNTVLERENAVDVGVIDITNPSNAAYIMFTSGSTGKPKGVVMSHSAVCTSIMDHGERLGFRPEWRVLQFSSHTFDVSIAEIFTTLAFGGCVCIPSDHQRLNGLDQTIRDLGVNVALLTPTVANLLVPAELPALHTLILGGEAISRDHITRWAGQVRVANGFGPTEASIYCSVNENLSVDDATNIGTATGGNNWVVDPNNHDLLSLIGCIGELVVSGSNIAQGYFADVEATNSAFVPAPLWLSEAGHSSSRIYKTGDLVRYKHDGSMQFIGRKDTQVKVRGLRIELGEIENHIAGLTDVSGVLVVLPSSGRSTGKLVAVVCFYSGLRGGPEDAVIELNPNLVKENTDARFRDIYDQLASKVPEYLIPSTCVSVKRIPLTSSGKMDRKTVKTWVENMSLKTYRLSSRSFGDFSKTKSNGAQEFPQGSLISELRLAWSGVLNVPIEELDADTTFLSVGGDSISAIQLVTKCKKMGISISMRDILKARTLRNLEALASRIRPVDHLETIKIIPSNELFDLSPVQRMFFAQNQTNSGSGRYNQSFTVRLAKTISPGVLSVAFDAVVKKHPMLRGRFVQKDNNWQQFYAEMDPSSYRLKVHGLLCVDRVTSIAEEAHSSISITKGPTFSVDIFDLDMKSEILFAAHHLVVDLVSWRVILEDLEDFVNTGSLSAPASTPFSSWSQALRERYDQSLSVHERLIAIESDIAEFWGISQEDNTYGMTEKVSWTLDPESTQSLLKAGYSRVRYEPVDMMISALVYSFQQTFVDRGSPTVFLEGHGREPWKPALDISSTVGWFTVMYPIFDFPTPDTRFLPTLNHVRGARRAQSDNGLDHFSRSMFHLDKEPTTSHALAREILFNYQGIYKQFDEQSSLFELVDYERLEKTMTGSGIRRNAIFEVEARVRDGRLEFSLAYNKNSRHNQKIGHWANKTKVVLVDILLELSNSIASHSVRNFLDQRFSDLQRQHFDNMLREKLGGRHDLLIEDAHPCTPTQKQMLKSRKSNPLTFRVKWGIEISTRSGNLISVGDLANAWREVVGRHAMLRTTFLCEDLDNCPALLQVVIQSPEPDITILHEISNDETTDSSKLDLNSRLLPHHLTILTTPSDSVKCTFAAHHSLLDGFSLRLIMRDFLAAYQHTLPSAAAPIFGDCASLFLDHQLNVDQQTSYWEDVLKTQPPCILPASYPSSHSSTASPGSNYTTITLSSIPVSKIQTFGSEYGLTISILIDAIWALTIASLMSPQTQSSICFGYVTSLRPYCLSAFPLADEVVGPMITVLPYHLQISSMPSLNPGSDVVALAGEMQEQRAQDSEYVFDDIEAAIERLGKGKLWNTGTNFQHVGPSEKATEMEDLQIKDLDWSDPWDFDIMVRIFADEQVVNVNLEFDTVVFSQEEMRRVSDCFEGLLKKIFE